MIGLHLEGTMALAKLIGDQDVLGFTFNDIATANDSDENTTKLTRQEEWRATIRLEYK